MLWNLFFSRKRVGGVGGGKGTQGPMVGNGRAPVCVPQEGQIDVLPGGELAPRIKCGRTGVLSRMQKGALERQDPRLGLAMNKPTEGKKYGGDRSGPHIAPAQRGSGGK